MYSVCTGNRLIIEAWLGKCIIRTENDVTYNVQARFSSPDAHNVHQEKKTALEVDKLGRERFNIPLEAMYWTTVRHQLNLAPFFLLQTLVSSVNRCCIWPTEQSHLFKMHVYSDYELSE